MNSFVAVVLYVTIVTGEGKPDIRHQEPMPDMATCIQELTNFLHHEFPNTVDAHELKAGCAGALAERKPS